MKAKQEMKLAENLKRVLAAQNRTVTKTAKQVGMNKSTLHGYCNGVVPRNIRQLKSLADFLEISLNDLLFGRGTEAPTIYANGNIEGRYLITLDVRRVDDPGKDLKR
jgi:transcriptional regulator with XRE-family HTH domain